MVKSQRRARRTSLICCPASTSTADPNSYPNYAVGWAMARSTPATWCINDLRTGRHRAKAWSCLAQRLSWPRGDPSAVHAASSTSSPTILEAVGIPEPKVINGVKQTPMAGLSMIYSFDNGDAKERHVTQYNEVHRQPQYLPPRLDGLA